MDVWQDIILCNSDMAEELVQFFVISLDERKEEPVFLLALPLDFPLVILKMALM